MSSNNRKRKHSRSHQHRDRDRGYDRFGAATPQVQVQEQTDYALYIQAHEADVIRGPQATQAAQSLDVNDYWSSKTHPGRSAELVKIGSALIRWSGSSAGGTKESIEEYDGMNRDSSWLDDGDDVLRIGGGSHDQGSTEQAREVFQSSASRTAAADVEDEIWVDRYDVRLLLDSLPPPHEPNVSISSGIARPSSPGGWSDLPSDAEDTFRLSPDEIEDMRRDKRRRKMDELREERLRARLAEDDDDGPVTKSTQDADMWGGSDEEPDDTQKELMRRTANHLLTSPNPAQLEMRILANHGGDKRFAFLRGRWSRFWRLIKAKIRIEMEHKKHQQQQAEGKASGLGGLTAYGDSDSDDGGDEAQAQQGADVQEHKSPAPHASIPDKVEEEGDQSSPTKSENSSSLLALQEARRLRAREWAEKRRAEKEAVQSP